MMKNLKIIVLGYFILSGCTKQDIPVPDPIVESCLDQALTNSVADSDEVWSWDNLPPLSPTNMPLPEFTEIGCGYTVPVFNPTNENQIAYKTKYCENERNGLRIHDFCTGENRLIVEGEVGIIDWSTKDWLVFQSGTWGGKLLYKIKSNGDSLTQLNNSAGYMGSLNWSPDGSKFLNVGDYAGNRIIIRTSDGELVQDLNISDCNGVDYQWLHDDIYYLCSNSYTLMLGKYNLSTQEHFELIRYEVSDGIYPNIYNQLEVAPDGEELYVSGLPGVIACDVQTGQYKEIIRTQGMSNYHGGVALSPDGDYLVHVRTTYEKTGNLRGNSDSHLVMKKLDGSEEMYRLELPE